MGLPSGVGCWLPILAGFAACGAVSWSPAGSHFASVVAKPGVGLRGLAAPGSGVVWASGTGGTVLRSRDGGSTWQDVGPAAAAASDLRAVVAWSAERAVVAAAGQPARVFRTTDGGQHWQMVLEDPRPAAFFDALARHGDTVYLLGDPVAGAFALWRSDDAGATWRALPAAELPAPQAGEAAFAAGGQCLEVDARGVRFVTGGTVARCVSCAGAGPWQAEALPLLQGQPSQGAFALASLGERMVVVGGDYREPLGVAGTAAWGTGAATLVPSQGAGLGYRSAVRWLDAQNVLAVGERGAGWSVDGGRTFLPFGAEGWHALAMAPDGAVFAAGAGGRIGRLQRR